MSKTTKLDGIIGKHMCDDREFTSAIKKYVAELEQRPTWDEMEDGMIQVAKAAAADKGVWRYYLPGIRNIIREMQQNRSTKPEPERTE